MSAAPTTLRADETLELEPIATTLLELIRTIGEITRDDREVVATVRHLLATGQVRLTGNFRDLPLELLRP